jgi:hypothetical protein
MASDNPALGCLEKGFHSYRDPLERVEQLGTKLRADDADRPTCHWPTTPLSRRAKV